MDWNQIRWEKASQHNTIHAEICSFFIFFLHRSLVGLLAKIPLLWSLGFTPSQSHFDPFLTQLVKKFSTSRNTTLSLVTLLTSRLFPSTAVCLNGKKQDKSRNMGKLKTTHFKLKAATDNNFFFKSCSDISLFDSSCVADQAWITEADDTLKLKINTSPWLQPEPCFFSPLGQPLL